MTTNPMIDAVVAEARRAELLTQAERRRRAAGAAAPGSDLVRWVRRALIGLSAAGILSLALVAGAAAHHEGHEGLNGAGFGKPTAPVGAGVAVVAVAVAGGDATTTTTIAVEGGAEGGMAIADAGGGDGNAAVEIDDGEGRG